MDRADVVRAWECCIDTENGQCAEDCPMKDAEWKDGGIAACRDFAEDHVEVQLALVQRTVELLKAQEPVGPTWRRGLAFCGKCGRQFGRGFKYCPDCGRAVKWE